MTNQQKPTVLDVAQKPTTLSPQTNLSSEVPQQPKPSQLLAKLAKEMQEIYLATLSLNGRIPESEKAVLPSLFYEFLPLLQMLAKNLVTLTGNVGIVSSMTEEMYEEGDEDYGDGEDDETSEDAQSDGDLDEGEEDDYVISFPVYQRIQSFLLLHGFVLPSGQEIPPEYQTKEAKERMAREIMLSLLYECEEEDYKESIDKLIAGYPNVPLLKELQEAAEAYQKALAQQQGQG